MNRIYCHDIALGLPQVQDQSVNCVVTSPPYYMLRDYGIEPSPWPELKFSPMPGLPEITVPAQTCCLGAETDLNHYVGHLVYCFREVWRCLRDDGVVWVNLGDSYTGNGAAYGDTKSTLMGAKQAHRMGVARRPKKVLPDRNLIGVPWRVAFALQADGWILRQDVIWSKPNAMPESVTNRCTRSHEYVFMFVKKKKYWYDAAAIAEPIAESTLRDKRLFNADFSTDRRERGFPGQPQQGSGLLRPKQDGHGRRHEGLNSRGYDTKYFSNKRSVWTVSTKAYASAHFAVFPPVPYTSLYFGRVSGRRHGDGYFWR